MNNQDQCLRAISDGEKMHQHVAGMHGFTAPWANMLPESRAVYEQAAQKLLAPANQRADNWESTAQQYARNSEHWSNQMREIAQHLGVEVFICDDGSMSQDPLLAKVPDLVHELAYANHRCRAALVHLAQGMDIYGDNLTPEQLVAHAIRATQDLKNHISGITKENERQMAEASRVMADQYTSMAKLVEQVTAEQEKNRELEKQIVVLSTPQCPAPPPPSGG